MTAESSPQQGLGRAAGDAVRPADRWFLWSGRHPMGALLITGFVAIQMATMLAYFMPIIGLPELSWPQHNGRLGAPESAEGSAERYAVGQFMHYLNGIAFTFVFGLLLHPVLPFRGEGFGNFGKALVFGAILTFVSIGFVTPQIYVPEAHLGFLSFGKGWRLPLAIFLWHMIFAGHLGLLYNPDRSARLVAEQRSTVGA